MSRGGDCSLGAFGFYYYSTIGYQVTLSGFVDPKQGEVISWVSTLSVAAFVDEMI